MTNEDIIQAFENLRYCESTDEIEWGRVLADADTALKRLKESPPPEDTGKVTDWYSRGFKDGLAHRTLKCICGKK